VKKPLRVLHVFRAMNRGGAETLIMNIYRKMDRHKIQFDFLINTKNEGHYDKEILELGGRIFYIPNPKETGLRKFNQNFTFINEEQGPFAAIHSHVHHFSGTILFIANKLNIPIRISHSHTIKDGYENSLLRNMYRVLMEFLIKKHSTYMLGCSIHACESLFGRKCWKDSRVEVIHNAVDFSAFENLQSDRFTIRETLGLPKLSKIIGHVGRFEEHKNHRFVIELFAQLNKVEPNSYLLLVGDGTLKKEMTELVTYKNLEKKVIFFGVREDVPEIMKSIDLFLFPSLYEGLGNVLIEAQASGVPCITSTGTPKDADLKMGLVKFIDLKESIDIWILEILESFNREPLGKSEIRDSFLSTGYNIEQVRDRLAKIYTASYFESIGLGNRITKTSGDTKRVGF